jgi:hypothetical protein
MRLVCVLLLLAPSGAGAQTVPVEFGLLDLDGDGFVTIAEAAGNAGVVTRFDRADRNRDGRLSGAEFIRLQKLKLRVAKTRRERVRTTLARDARAAERETAAEVADSAAAGATR